jgi:putative secretion ATPase (PEP-CTERM system associated)
MYEAFYHLQTKPFLLSPDPRFFFSSRGHRRAIAYLVYGARQGEGFIVITGEIGAGKTMLAATLAQRLAPQNLVLGQIVSTRLGPDDLVRMVAAAFGVAQHDSKAVLLDRLGQFLLACNQQGKRAVLVVDEAQNLPSMSVEELRMLSNFVQANRPLLQTFLLGQPEFRRTLQGPDMEQLRQRVIAAYHLEPLDQSETEAYILHRLQVAGWQGDPSFSADAFAAIHAYAAGIPRRVNILCDRLMLMGCLDKKHAFSSADVAVVTGELHQELAPADPLVRREWRA